MLTQKYGDRPILSTFLPSGWFRRIAGPPQLEDIVGRIGPGFRVDHVFGRPESAAPFFLPRAGFFLDIYTLGFCRNLLDFRFERFPGPVPRQGSVAGHLAPVQSHTTHRNLLFTGELASILEACEARQVWCAPLRGLAFAENLFADTSLRPMGDIDRLIRKNGPGLDWSMVVSAADGSGQGFFIHLVLEEIVEIFDTPVPVEVLASLPDELSPTREGRIASFLADCGEIDGKESLALMLASKGVKVRIRYLFSLLFPTTAFMRIQYELTNRYQYPFAYIKRFGYFLKEGIRGVVAIIRPRR